MNLKILTWNIAFGYGKHSEGGPGYKKKSRAFFEDRLNKISDFIRSQSVDIALLQEVDFASSRSHYIDELDWISRRSGLYHRQKVVSWNHPFVPYPGLNPLNFFGTILSGGGVISKYPIEEIHSQLLPKPNENSKLYNYFYLSRYLQAVEVKAEQSIRIGNLHLEAFSQGNRKLHLQLTKDFVLDQAIDLTGGDFNGGIEIETGNTGLETLPTPEPSFPAESPDQYLDGFILNSARFQVMQMKTLHSGLLSDHFPILLEIQNRA